MSARHTEGPWSVVPYGDGDSLVIHSDGERRVCFLATPGCRDTASRNKSWQEIKANARLIAAAPELLEACEALLDRYRIMVAADGPECLQAIAAIAKARGAA